MVVAYQSDFGKPITNIKPNAPNYLGTLSDYQIIKSKALGYDLRYRVYVPPGYESLSDLPSIYLTDGPSYLSEQAGNMVQKIDILLEEKKIKPLVAIFIDPRDPYRPSVNKRNSQFLNNPHYVEFVTTELVPHVDKFFNTSKKAQDRVIMGLSFGGLNAAYFGVKAHSTFYGVGMQSPAMHPRPEIYSYYLEEDVLPIKIYLSTGTRNDTEVGTRKLKGILDKKGYQYKYREVPYGHNWRNWGPLVNEALLFFFASE